MVASIYFCDPILHFRQQTCSAPVQQPTADPNDYQHLYRKPTPPLADKEAEADPEFLPDDDEPVSDIDEGTNENTEPTQGRSFHISSQDET